jgi:LysM repeat protein
MNSIRPLITISILIAAGVFLYTKINENPARLVPEGGEAAQTQSGVPPLGAPMQGGAPNGPGALTPSAANDAAPQWSAPIADSEKTCPVAPAAAPPAKFELMSKLDAASKPSAALTPDSIGLPEVPKIPDLPPLPATPEAAASPAPPSNSTSAPPAVSPLSLNSPAQTAPAASTSDDDRYGSVKSSSAPANLPAAMAPPTAATGPAPGTFAADWPAIQSALAQQELGKAHQMLSKWYGSSTLSPTEAEQVQSLLSQLAGTVVYSTQSCLEPPYTVRSGDTMESIAKKYDVPWQLLAKINGIPAADLVQPGQQLKVIHGPFTATVDLGKNQLTLMVDGRYAGRFAITAETGASASAGEWAVEQKLSAPSTGTTGTANSVYAVAGPASVDHVLVLKKESLAGVEISITSGPTSPSSPTAAAPPAFHLAPRDADEVADILSVGSRVTIK